MANTIKHKRGTSTPTASDLVAGELAINTSNGDVFTKTDSNTVVQVGREVVDDTSPQLGGDLASNGNNINIADDDAVFFGTSDDLQIYHSGSYSYIKDTGTGALIINSDSVVIKNAGDTEDIAKFVQNGAVELYYDNAKKLETKTNGVKVTGVVELTSELDFTGSSNKYVDFYTKDSGGTAYSATLRLVNHNNTSFHNAIKMVRDGAVELYHAGSKKIETTSSGISVTGTVTADGVDLGDDERLNLGASDDLQIYHDGSNSNIVDTGTGNLNIQANEFYLKSANGGVTAIHYDPNTNHQVSLYHNNSQKLKTTGSGVEVTGKVFADGVDVGDGDKIRFGDGNDLEIFHTADNASYIRDVGTGNLNIDSTGGNVQIRVSTNEPAIVAKQDGAVDLYHNNVKKLETTSTGVEISSGGILGVKNSGAQSELRLYCESSNAHYASIKAPPHSDFSGNITFTLPGTDGNANQVLKTDGAGNLGWVDQSSGGGGSGISRAQATAVTLIFG